MKFFKYIAMIVVLSGIFSCDDFLDIEPKDRVIPTTLADYQKLLISGYDAFPETKSKSELRTDLVDFNNTDGSAENYRDIFLWNDLNYDNAASEFDYEQLYRVIFYANEVINEGGKKLSKSDEKDQLMAEAHALRAYAYFELVNLFSDVYEKDKDQKGVPLVLEMDLENEFKILSLDNIYRQIHADLAQAEKLAKVKEFGENKNYHFSKLAIKALKSRVNLYQGNWDMALKYVDEVLTEKSILMDLNNNPDSKLPNDVGSVEQILVLDYAINDKVNQVSFANEFLMNKYDSEDLRKTLFYSENNKKYKAVKGKDRQTMSSFRTGELYLVKAELLTRKGDLSAARDVLNALVKTRKTPVGAKAYQDKIQNLGQMDLLAEVFEERVRELAFEGYRWFDLRRYDQKSITHKAGNISAELKAKDPRYTIAFPKSARLENPNLN